jgi:hypothetical protein
VKDKKGRYLCQPCVERLKARKRHAEPDEPIPLAAGDGDVMASLLGSSKVVSSPPCSQCGAPMSAGAVVCVQCGYHHGAGAAITTQVARMGPAEGERAASAAAAAFSFPGAWVLGSIALSILGGLLGTVVWYAIARATGFEIGWIAIGVGLAAGAGAAIGARGNEGLFTALIACAVALLAIGLAKYQVASAEYNEFVNQPADELLAKQVLAEVIQAEAGTSTRVRPLGRRRFGSWERNNMSDSEAAAAAEEAWREEMTDEDREEFIAMLADTQESMRLDPFAEKAESVKENIGIFDYIFGFFAIVAALGAGSGGQISFGDD